LHVFATARPSKEGRCHAVAAPPYRSMTMDDNIELPQAADALDGGAR
jgi:hypothetical protein